MVKTEYYEWAIKALRDKNLLVRIQPKNCREQFYIATYKPIIDLFREEKSNLIKYAIIYSWMPTIPKMPEISMEETEFNRKCQQILSSINEICRKGKLEESEKDFNSNFSKLKKLLNGSEIAASKFLHFHYPEVFPMWDTSMIKWLKDKGVETYWQFVTESHKVIKDSGMEKRIKKWDSGLSAVRLLEQLVWKK